ncbi:unnamed protein product [Rotaria magnacalcarata]|nr:unnamed protein product [Rotaria magnacalcarata]
MGKINHAEKYYRRLLNELHEDDPLLAHVYYNIGLVAKLKCDYDNTMSYNNVGNIRLHLNHQSIALECLKKALEIRTKAFPPDHPDIASSQKNLGDLYESTNEFRLALECFHNASEIYHKIWQPNHPDVIEINADIQRVSDKLENA